MKGKLVTISIVLFFMVSMVLVFSVFAQADGVIVMGENGIDNFEYSSDEQLNSVYTMECDFGTSMTAHAKATSPHEGNYCAALKYSLSGLWSKVKVARYFPVYENWSKDKKISFWVKGYSGCTENLLIYLIESDGDEWIYQNKTALVNEAWTKIVMPLGEGWDNPWDGDLGDGIETLEEVIGYKIAIEDVRDDGSSPIDKTIYIDKFVRDNGSPSAAHLIPGIDNHIFYLGKSLKYPFMPIAIDGVASDLIKFKCYYRNRIEDLAKYDLIIINAEDYNAEEIVRMKKNGAVVMGCISLAEDVRELQTGDGKGPISSGVLTYGGYASYYLDENPKDGYPDSCAGYYVNAGNAEWQKFIISQAKAIVDVRGKNCDGIFLNNMGRIIEQDCYKWTEPGVLSLIATLRKTYPNKFLIANRGFSIFEDFEKYVNAIVFESFTSTYDFNMGTYKKWSQGDLNYTADIAKKLNVACGYPQQKSVNVLGLDYCNASDIEQCKQNYLRAESFGFVPAVSDICLSKMYMVNPANEFKAFVVLQSGKNRVDLRWAVARDEYITDSNVMNYVIKRSTIGPIITDKDWEKAQIVSKPIAPYATKFTDINPPKGQVYYAIGAVRNGGMNLIGHPTTSCFVK